MDGCESAENDPYKVSMNSGKILEILINYDDMIKNNEKFLFFFSNFWLDFPEFVCSTTDNSSCQQRACLCDVEMVNQVWVKFEISSKIRIFHISIVF